MSDPVSNVEIEDVLSSIRRLVSENAKASSPEALILQPKDRIGAATPKPSTTGPQIAADAVVADKPRVLSTGANTARKEPVLSRSLNTAKVEDAVHTDFPPMPSIEEPIESVLEEAVIEAAETQALEETISHIEASVASQDADWEPDDVFTTDNDPTIIEDDNAMPSATETMDMEMLREVVTDMIRQELRGALGEKITRNVRKLVRREIQRAVTTKDFK